MKYHIKRKLSRKNLILLAFSLIISITMGSSLVALADGEEPAPIQDLYEIKGVKYYNTGSASFDDDGNQYLKEVLENKSKELACVIGEGEDAETKIEKRSMTDLWLEVAAGLLHGKDIFLHGGFSVAMDKSIGTASPYSSFDVAGVHYDIDRYLMTGMKSDDMKSLKNAERYVYRKADINAGQVKNGNFMTDDAEQTVAVGVLKASSSNDTRVAAVYFTNFKIVALLPEDSGNNYVTTVLQNDTDYSSAVASSVRNNTGSTATGSQKVSESYSASMSSTVSKTETFSFQESINVSNEFSSGLFNKFKVDVSFTASQAFQEGWSSTEGVSDQNGGEQSISVTLPPFTNVMMTQKTTNAEYLIRYNCPVGIVYDVIIVIYDDNGVSRVSYTVPGPAANNSPMVFKFQNNARTALGTRFKEWKEENDFRDDEGILWDYVTVYDSAGDTHTHIAEAIGKASTYVPMAPTGAQYRQKLKLVSGEIAGVVPIYPLKKVRLDALNIPRYEDSGSYNNYNYLAMKMSVGDSTYTNYFTLSGYNEYDVPYAGFSKNFGYWKVVDENGREWTDENAPLRIEKESVSGYPMIRAVNPGICYLKYFINDNTYNTASYPDHYTTNSDLVSTAVIKVTVADVRSIEVDGSFDGYVDEDPEALDADGKLYASVCDETGVETDVNVTWEKKEKNGISLSGNMVSFTKPGTYHVRACAGTLKTDWVAITAKYRTCDVTFKPQNGEKDEIVTVRKEQTVGELSFDHAKCEIFTGWFTDKDCTELYKFDTPVTGDFTLYGGWETSHDWGEWKVIKAATEKTEGTETRTCLRDGCGASQTRSIPLTTHVHSLSKINAKEATCTEKGNTAYWICDDKDTGCGRIFSDAKGEKEIDLEETVTKASGHSWDAGSVTVSPSVTAEGEKKYTCTVCGAEKKETIARLPEEKQTEEKLPEEKPEEKPEEVNVYAKMAASGRKAELITWQKVENADGYMIYFAPCDTNDTYGTCKLIKTIKNNNTFRYTKKGLKKGKAYKSYVAAYKNINGRKVVIGKSLLMHSVTGNETKKYTNPKKVTVKKSRISLKKGKTYKIKGQKITSYNEKLKLLGHEAKFRYISTNPKIAKVSKKGVITGKSKGKCKVYIVAINGFTKAVSVTVK